MKKSIFITGISGCVGHYLFEVLVKDRNCHLNLLLRNPERLKFDLDSYPNVTVINGDLRNIEKHSLLLKEMDYAVHLAAAWGSQELNYDYTLALFNLLDPDRCKKIIYFSTASILDSDNQPLKEAGEFGTSYIRSKYLCYKKLPELRIYDRIITLFPTWVLGGDDRHPYSHASSGIMQMLRWLWIIRFFKADVNFHFIHARDLAFIVDYLLRNDVEEPTFVPGNPVVTVEEFIKKMCKHFNKKIYFQINISPLFVKSVALLLGRKLSAWDRFCLEKRHFEHKVANPQTFGIESNYENVADILRELHPWGRSRRR